MAPPRIKVRGAGRGKGVPRGYILGRTGRGTGDVQLLRLQDLQSLGIASVHNVAETTSKHGFGFFVGGLPVDNEFLGSAVFAEDLAFVNGNTDTIVNSSFPAHSSAVMNVKSPDPISGLDVIVGTFTFAAGSATAVVAWTGGAFTLLAGKPVKLYAPTPRDTSLADIHGIVEGTGS